LFQEIGETDCDSIDENWLLIW